MKRNYYPNQNAIFEGRFYTTSIFDQKAENFAASVRKYKISLIDGKKLKKIFFEVGFPLQ